MSALADEIRAAVAAALEADREKLRALIREELLRVCPADDRLVDVHEAARLIGVKPGTLQRRAWTGSLPDGTVVRHGRRVMYRVRALLGHST